MATRDYYFISPPDPNLYCSICLDLAHDAHQCSHCGKLFCSECAENIFLKRCPNCRAKTLKYFRDVKSGRDIKELGVRCANLERGCPWTGTIGTLDTHLATCEFALVPCPNKCEDDRDGGEIQLMKKDLNNHLKTKCPKRPFWCPHCGEKGTYASIAQIHDNVCDKKTVACPNKRSGCIMCMERWKTKYHVKTNCEYTEVACAHESLGCEERIFRKDKKKHETEINTGHFGLMLNIAMSSLEHITVSENYKKLLGQFQSLSNEYQMQSEQIQSLSNKFKMQVQCFTQQIKSLSDQNKMQSEQLQLLSEQVRSLPDQHETLPNGEEILFKLPGYASKNAENEKFYSPPFYTHPGGYKMRIRVNANGVLDGAGTHVSVFTEILQGQYDDQLQWPFLGTVSIELLNQLADKDHFRRLIEYDVVTNMQVGSSNCRYKFVPHSSLRHDPATNTQYLLDDAMYFRVSVTVDNYKPWLIYNRKTNGNLDRVYLLILLFFCFFISFCYSYYL